MRVTLRVCVSNVFLDLNIVIVKSHDQTHLKIPKQTLLTKIAV